MFSSEIPLRGDKVIKIAKGRLKDLIFQIHPAGSRASPCGLHQFPTELSTMFCSGCLWDQTSYPISAIENKVLVLINTLKYHFIIKTSHILDQEVPFLPCLEHLFSFPMRNLGM